MARTLLLSCRAFEWIGLGLILATLAAPLPLVAQTRTDRCYATVVDRETTAWTFPGRAEGVVDDCENGCPCGTSQNNVAYNDSTSSPAKFRWLYSLDFGALPSDLTSGQRAITSVRINLNGRYNGNDGVNRGCFDVRVIVRDGMGAVVFDQIRAGDSAFPANAECAWRIENPQRDISTVVDWNAHPDWLSNIEVHVRRGTFALSNRMMMVNAFRVVVESDPGPECTLDTAALDFGNQVPIGGYADRTFTITNTGYGTLAGAVSEACPEFEILGATKYSLAHNQAQAFTVRYAPLDPGGDGCDIQTGCGASILATGGGIGPICSVVPDSTDLGAVLLGNGASAVFRISNVGGGVLTGSVVEDCPAFDVVQGGGSYSLGPGQWRDVVLTFSPPSAGAFSCRVVTGCAQDHVAHGIASVGGACCYLGDCYITTAQDCGGFYQYQGDGTACLLFSPPELLFPPTELGSSVTQVVHLRNPGSAPLAGALTLPPGAGFQILGNSDYALAPGDSVAFQIRFTPTELDSQDVLLMAECAGCPLRGLGVSNTASWDAQALDFGDVPIGGGVESVVQLVSDAYISGTLSTTCNHFSIVGDTSIAGPRTVIVRFEATVPDTSVAAIIAEIGDGTQTLWLPVLGTGVTVSEAEDSAQVVLVSRLALHVPNPNPSRGAVAVSYDLPLEDRVRLDVFDVSGRRVHTLVDAVLPAGTHRTSWSGETALGGRAAAGIYFLRLVTSDEKAVQQLVRFR